jgi:hypothetical protein
MEHIFEFHVGLGGFVGNLDEIVKTNWAEPALLVVSQDLGRLGRLYGVSFGPCGTAHI